MLFFLFFLSILGFLYYKGESSTYFFVKKDTYECGFGELFYSHSFYTMQFFLIALSFMLFDLEIIFVLPFIISEFFSFFSYFFVVSFLLVLMLGLFFEFKTGKVMWSS
uniref:NADH-ubiquinone oxidoreductase chain 3 n=1 Tax=Clavelina lepadiformis TaxID=159417 RepID=D0Z5Q6_CLALP|nr:NADH dehydrogenase subunit 3 [Clavelina lepadiformis]